MASEAVDASAIPAIAELLLWLPPQTATDAAIVVTVVDALGIASRWGELRLAPDASPADPHALPEDFMQSVRAARTVRAVIAAEDVLCLGIEAPTMRARQARRAVPFLVEEHLACELDAVQVAFGPLAGARLRVAVVAHERIAYWLDRLAAHGIRLDALTPEPCLLGAPPDTARVLICADRWLVDAPDHTSGVLHGPQAGPLLARLLAENPPRHLELFDAGPYPGFGEAEDAPDCTVPASIAKGGEAQENTIPASIADVCAVHGIAVTSTRLDADPACWLSRVPDTRADLPDFLDGAYQRRRRVRRTHRWWELPAVAALLLVLVTGTNVVLGVHTARAARHDTQAAQALYRSLFPEESRSRSGFSPTCTPMPDCSQMHTALGALHTRLRAQVAAAHTPPPPRVATRLHQALAPLQAPAQANEAGLRSLVFDRNADRLVLQALFARVDQAEAYRRSVDAPDWPVQLEDIRPSATAIEVRVRFGREAAP